MAKAAGAKPMTKSEMAAKIGRREREHEEAVRLRRAHDGGPRLLAAAEAFVKWWHTFEGAQMIAEIRHPDVTEFYAAIEASKTDNEANRNG